MLLLASSVCGLFKWRQFEPEVILMAVGWYLRFSLSYRDVEELLAERGLHDDHVTVWRWVQRYAPEMERRLRSRLKQTNDSWRVDVTYIRVKGKWVYLYRLQWCDDRLLALGQTRHSGRQALSGQILGRCEPSAPIATAPPTDQRQLAGGYKLATLPRRAPAPGRVVIAEL